MLDYFVWIFVGLVLGALIAVTVLLILFKKKEPESDLSISEWYELEYKVVDGVIEKEKDPLAYVNDKMSEKNVSENHYTALDVIKAELTKEQALSDDIKIEEVKEEVKEPVEEDEEVEETYVDDADDTEEIPDFVEEVAEEVSEEEKEKRKNLPTILEEERLAFITARKANAIHVPIPRLRYTFTREYVFDHIEDAKKDKVNYPLPMTVTKRKGKGLIDYLFAGKFPMGVMYDSTYKICMFILRLKTTYANKIIDRSTAVTKINFTSTNDWYEVIIDLSIKDKKEALSILDESYDYVLGKYFGKDKNGKLIYHEEKALKDFEEIKKAAEEYNFAPRYVLAVNDYTEALNKFNELMPIRFELRRVRILSRALKKAKANEEVVKNKKIRMPARLKIDEKAYALIYEIPGDTLTLVLKLPDDFVTKHLYLHPTIQRARFPKGRYYYKVKVDGGFVNSESVYKMIDKAKEFVKSLV